MSPVSASLVSQHPLVWYTKVWLGFLLWPLCPLIFGDVLTPFHKLYKIDIFDDSEGGDVLTSRGRCDPMILLSVHFGDVFSVCETNVHFREVFMVSKTCFHVRDIFLISKTHV